MAVFKNNGQPISFDPISTSLEEKRVQAKEFAEGSKELEDLLMFLWENGIQTIGSCSGHNGERFPDVSFYAKNIDDKTLRKIMVGLNSQQDVYSIDASAGYYGREIYIGIVLKKDKNASFENTLKSIKDAFNKELSADEFKEKYTKLPQEEKDFIESVISVKALGNMQNMCIPNMKEFYPGIPKDTKWKSLEIRKHNDEISYGCDFEFKKVKGYHIDEFKVEEGDGSMKTVRRKYEGYSHCYTKCGDDKCYIIDENTKEPIYMTIEEAKAKGYVTEKEFSRHMISILPEDKKFFDKIKESAIIKEVDKQEQYEYNSIETF